MLAALSAVVLVVVVAPVARIVVDREVRQMFPRLALGLAAALVGWWVAVGLLALVRPTWLAAVAAGSLVVAAALRWRARSRAGGRPPGSRSISASVRGLAHRDTYQRLADRYGPVFSMSQVTNDVVCVVGLERGQRLLREHREALGPAPLPFTQQLLGDFLRYMDDDTHDRYGPRFRRAMSARVTAAAEPVTRAATAAGLATVRPGGPPVPLEPILAEVARDTVAHALFGIEPGSLHHAAYVEASSRLAGATLLHPLDRRALGALDDLRELVAARHDALVADGGPTCALGELVVLDPGPPDPVAVDNLVMMAKIGTGNLVGLLRWMVVLVADSGRLDRSAGPEHSGPEPGLVEALVLETLRLSQSEYVYRRLRRDVEFEGHRLPAGWLVRFCVAESHRDPDLHPDPDRFTDRFVGRRPDTSELCPFGVDRHACNSAGLVLGTARVVLEELLAAAPLAVSRPDRPTREPRHWSHWRPAGPILLSAPGR